MSNKINNVMFHQLFGFYCCLNVFKQEENNSFKYLECPQCHYAGICFFY